mmetsp:Transcript_9675/g.13506  ORF Transcript_9675/g.13506 Transcript_9675/m.13506 type:complete len:87 (+) Transcript_9675:243-503(+)
MWEAMVFDLVVQPSMPQIHYVSSGGKIGGAHHSPEEEGGGVSAARCCETVEIVSSVVGDNGDETVDVGDDVSQDEVYDSIVVVTRA